MTFINYAAREINCKIVYYGPGLCGKTTNLQYIYDRTNPAAKGKLKPFARSIRATRRARGFCCTRAGSIPSTGLPRRSRRSLCWRARTS